MRIKKRLWINNFISIGTVFFILLSFGWSFREMYIADLNIKLTDEMRKVAFERILLRDEYLLYQEDRAKFQWLAKSGALRDLLALADTRFDQKTDRTLLQDARKDFEATFSGFSRFMEGSARQAPGANKKADVSDAEAQLVSQVFLKAYSLTDNINRLHESARKRETDARNRGAFIVIIIILGGIIVLIINSTIIRRTLTERIAVLSKGVEILGSGDLDYRITVEGDDELTDLAQASNEMSAKLKESHTSIESLQREMAEREKAEEELVLERNKLAATIENTNIGLVLCDQQGDNISMNKAALRFHDFASLTEMHGRLGEYADEWELRYPDGRLMTLEEWPMSRAIRGDYVVNYETYLLNVKTGYRWIGSYSAAPARNSAGEVMLIVMTILDITDRKKKEREIEAKNAELERFTYTVSHDLKSPLVTVKTFLGYLQADLAAGDTEKSEKDMNYMRSAAEKMGQLLDELLEMSRVGRMVNPPVFVSFQELVDEALTAVAGSIAERGVTIEVRDTAVSLYGDQPRLVEIWQNLIENSVKYMGDQKTPRIEIGAELINGETVFFVCDNGIGIDPRYKDKVFGLFEKLDPKTEGTGLGLALVKRIIELYRGRIWLESEGSGKGTCFRFTLPEAINIQNKGGRT